MNGSRSDEGRAALIGEVRRAYLDALVAGDPGAAEAVVREAIDGGLSEATIGDDVVAPAMRRIGDLWERGEIGVAEEHLATSISYRVLALERELRRVARERWRERVLLAAPAGERHVLGLEIVARLLETAGYDVLMLGPDVPVDALVRLAERHAPSALGLSVTMPGPADGLRDTIDRTRAAVPWMGVLLGGAGVPAAVAADPSLLRAESAAEAVDLTDALVRGATRS